VEQLLVVLEALLIAEAVDFGKELVLGDTEQGVLDPVTS